MQKRTKRGGHKIRIKKNDIVEMIAGRDRGKSGKVLQVLRERNRLIVEKVNMIKRHTRPSPTTGQGGIIEKEGSVPVSNVKLVCPKCAAATRVGRQVTAEGQKVRVCKKCNEIIEG